MQEPYFWYVFHVRTGAENRVVQDMSQYVGKHDFSPYEVEPFCPESEVYFRGAQGRQLGKTYKKRPLFSGYVFVETTMPASEFLTTFGSYIYSSQDIVRILKSGSSDNIAVPIEERQRLEYLLKNKRCVERSVGYIVGDKVVIKGGPLVGLEGMIKYINRHNRYADIEIDMFGGKIKARCALEIVEKS